MWRAHLGGVVEEGTGRGGEDDVQHVLALVLRAGHQRVDLWREGESGTPADLRWAESGTRAYRSHGA
jgi:hypothetical protein